MSSHLCIYETLPSDPILIDAVLDTVKSYNVELYRYKYWKSYYFGALPKGSYFDCYRCCVEEFFRDAMTLEERDFVYSGCRLVRLPKEIIHFYPREKVWDFSTGDKFLVGKEVSIPWTKIGGYEDINFFSKGCLLSFLQIENPKSASTINKKFVDHLHFAEVI